MKPWQSVPISVEAVSFCFSLAVPRRSDRFLAKTLGLFIVTAVAEIAVCDLPYLWLKKGSSAWLLLPAAGSLVFFAWLLALHPTVAGRVRAPQRTLVV
jgi:Uncharacterised BCR, YnfA/UPF0060 family